MNGQLEVQRKWYMEMLWGRLLYNPATADDVFKKSLAFKYPQLASDKLFAAWSLASRSLSKITELVQGTWSLDFHWYSEGCISNNGFRNIEDMGGCTVADGSNLCSIASSASSGCGTKTSSYALADSMEADANSALSLINAMTSGGSADLDVVINNVKQLAYLSNYYAYKIRGATHKKAKQSSNAQAAMGQAYCWWMRYANSMDAMYSGMTMQRVSDIPNWHWNDAAVLREFTDLGGSAAALMCKP